MCFKMKEPWILIEHYLITEGYHVNILQILMIFFNVFFRFQVAFS